MKTLVREILGSEQPTLWRQLACWRNVAELAVAGSIVSEITGRTSELAEQDAELVNQVLLSFSATSATVQSRRRGAEEKIVDAPMSTLVPMLDVLKWGSHDTILRPPASSAAIQEAEKRLGIELPEDYKQFLLISNGIEFMPSINAPGFKPVEELKWQDAEELGLDGFHVDLGCKTDPAEYERLPKMGRVLVISDDSEEQLWYVELDTVVEAIRVLKTEGRSDDVVGEPGLRVVFWANYLPDLEWLKSFRGYMEGLARKAGEVSAT
ncbi:hypothetical protein DAEQUDRAFT_727729 [Daedalea quercina L-15889]|uniref:Knr4/Smi1-like domain-containing protein n=1 Tax=Daedalea quercina L-15889 TaxID=1314783 RepID=A0A165PTL3_9APHY|nr:hypothetical protein DAEQUDRAFT_727729 [Daedalea quercina L-15889]